MPIFNHIQLQTLENLYSPSFWNKRFTPDGVIDEHVKFVTEESESAKSTIPYKTLKYGESGHEKIEFFETKYENPIFVYISGGYWQFLSGDISSYPVKPYVKNDISVAIVDYDRAPKGMYYLSILPLGGLANQFLFSFDAHLRLASQEIKRVS